MFTLDIEVIVCIQCEKDSHISCNCINSALLRNKQNILKIMILDDRDQYSESVITDTDSSTLMTINNALPHNLLTVEVHFIMYDMTGLQTVSENVNFTEVFLRERSELNKQSYVEEVTSLTVSLISQSSVSSTAFQLRIFTEQGFFFQSVSVQNENECLKKRVRNVQKRLS